MIDLKKILPIALFICCQSAYDNFAPSQSTNWSIFYFVSQHFAWLLVCLGSSNALRFKKSLPYYALAIGFTLHIIRLLSKINMPYEEFRTSVNSYEGNILLTLLIITLLIIVRFSYQKWQK